MTNFIVQKILFILMLSLSIPVTGKPSTDRLIIFHIDLNSVSLKEEYIRKWLENVADMGYNAVLWEIEDEIKWETCRECASPDAFSPEKFQDILNYSRGLGLEPIPLFQTIGHAEYVLQHPQYFPFRENPEHYDCYCTTNPEVRKFLKKWIEEYLDIFGDIRYFHLGGDEAYRFGSCPQCSAKVAEIGANQLYMEHMNDIAEPILKKGIRPGVWSDMILKHPESLSIVPKEFVFWDWNYWDTENSPSQIMVWSEAGRIPIEKVGEDIVRQFPGIMDSEGNLRPFYTSDKLKSEGYDVILCSASRSYGDGVFAGPHHTHAPNIFGAAKKTITSDLLGTCVTSWAVRIPNYETQAPWLYIAPLAIKNPALSYQEVLDKTLGDLFGITDEEFYEAISLIGISVPFADKKSTGIQWTNLKDSRPAPPGFIKDLIEKWKSSGNGETWLENKAIIEGAPEKINAGITRLNEFVPKSTKGFEILKAWSKAGYHQFWQSLVANEIVRYAEGNPEISSEEMVALLKSLRSDYKAWAESWMTPASAEVNTGLIFDAIICYFSEY